MIPKIVINSGFNDREGFAQINRGGGGNSIALAIY